MKEKINQVLFPLRSRKFLVVVVVLLLLLLALPLTILALQNHPGVTVQNLTSVTIQVKLSKGVTSFTRLQNRAC